LQSERGIGGGQRQ